MLGKGQKRMEGRDNRAEVRASALAERRARHCRAGHGRAGQDRTGQGRRGISAGSVEHGMALQGRTGQEQSMTESTAKGERGWKAGTRPGLKPWATGSL